MEQLKQQKFILTTKIKKMGYESLRYSIFNEHRPLEWETRIEFNTGTQEYEVYSTMDRASKGGIFTFPI